MKIPSRSGRNRLAANSCLAAFGTKTCSYVEIIDHGSRVARRMVEMLRSYHWLAAVQTAIVALDEAALDDEGMMTETGKISAAVVEFADVQVIDDDGPKVLVRLGEIDNGEPVDVAVVVMAPELANILSAKLAEATFEANWGPILRISSN